MENSFQENIEFVLLQRQKISSYNAYIQEELVNLQSKSKNEIKERLTSLDKLFSLNGFSSDHFKVAFKQFGPYNIFGDEGADTIRNLIFLVGEIDSEASFSLATRNLEIYKQQWHLASALIDRLRDLKIPSSKKWTRQGIQIHFKNNANLNSIKELSRETGKWNKALHGFARVVGSNETDFKILNIEKGSFIVTLAAIATTVLAVAKATHEVLKMINTSLNIKQKKLELEKMKIPALKPAIDELENQSKIEADKKADEISIIILNNFNYSGNDKEEVHSALKFGTKHLIEFHLKNGEIQLNLNKGESEENRDLLEELNKASKQRLLQEEELKKLDPDGDHLNLLE